MSAKEMKHNLTEQLQIAYRKSGGLIQKFYKGGTSTYNSSDKEETSEEEKIDRMKKYGTPRNGISYNYVPGAIHSISGISTTPIQINTNTGKYVKLSNGIHLPAVELTNGNNQQRVINTTEPAYDVYRFPNRQVVKRRIPDIPINLPPELYPDIIQRNDNTSTSGSKNPGNITQGTYPGSQPVLDAPEGYEGQVAVKVQAPYGSGGTPEVWVDKKTGKVLGRKEPKPNPSGSFIIEKFGGLIPNPRH